MLSKSGLSAVWTNGLLGVQKINYEQTSLSPSIIEKCDVSFKRNLCEKNRMVVYKHEGILTCQRHVGKL
jgi:hypothetical protein